ncbi:CTD small phosphatase-like protein 2-B [Arapaima gigas]
MILRSGRIPSRGAAQAATSGRLRPRPTGRRKSAREAEQSGAARKEEALPNSHTHASEDKTSPAVIRCRRLQLRVRRRAVTTEDSDAESEFKTPVRPRQPRVHFQDDPVSTPNGPMRNIYSPIVRFLTPAKASQQMLESPSPSVKSPEDAMLTPQQFVFGYGFFSPSGEESGDEVFNPYTFMKDVQSQSQSRTSRPFLRDIPVKTRSTPKATLVLDLDETLVFTSLSVIEDAEYTFRIFFQNHEYKVYMKLRPHVKEFLQSMSKIFEMLVYTSAKKEYAEKILKILDPRKKLFRHCLYQEDCLCVLGHYVKDLGILERDLAKTVALDNAPHTFPYHQMNRITVESWTGDESDQELLKLIPFLVELSEADDFREVLKMRSVLPIDL